MCRGLRHHHAANGRRTGERHDVDVGVSGDCGTNICASADEDVEDAVGHTRFGCQASECQRRQRSDLRGFEYHRAPGGQRGQHFPHGHLQGVVPRSDRPDDPDGFTSDRRRVLARVLRARLAVEIACDAGEEVDVVDTARHVEFRCETDRLTGVGDLLARQQIGVGVEQTREGMQYRRPLSRGGSTPIVLCARGMCDRRGNVGAGREYEVRHRRIGGGIDDRVVESRSAARSTVDPTTGNCRDG